MKRMLDVLVETLLASRNSLIREWVTHQRSVTEADVRSAKSAMDRAENSVVALQYVNT